MELQHLHPAPHESGILPTIPGKSNQDIPSLFRKNGKVQQQQKSLPNQEKAEAFKAI